MAVDYNELLYEKLQAEYNAYIESLKQMTPEQVIENAYQKVFKEDLIIAFENANLEPLEAKALYLEKYPLDKLYTVEGNSGDTCRTKTYTVGSSVIYGYGIPAY